MTGVVAMLISSKTAPALSASLSPSDDIWNFVFNEFGPDYYVSGPVTVTPVGGEPPFSYFWETISGDAVAFSQTASPFSMTGAAAVLRCLVTDANGTTALTNNCTIS